MFNYRTIDDLNQIIRNGIPVLPWKPDVIAGVHRSGMLAATMFAAHLNVPVISVKDFCRGCDVYAGYRSYIPPEEQEVFLAPSRRVLVVEDACNEGNTLRQEIERIEAHADLTGRHEIHYLSVYISDPAVLNLPTNFMYFERVEAPRLFEWNWMNHSVLANSCIEIEGVMCRRPDLTEADDGERYAQYVANVEPMFTSKRKVGRIVTQRLGKWREMTEGWLLQHGITYDKLDMMPCETAHDRNKWGVARFKHDIYFNQGGMKLLVEDRALISKEIWQLSKLPVLCIETRELLQG